MRDELKRLLLGKVITDVDVSEDRVALFVRSKRNKKKTTKITFYIKGDVGADGGWYQFLFANLNDYDLGKIL